MTKNPKSIMIFLIGANTFALSVNIILSYTAMPYWIRKQI